MIMLPHASETKPTPAHKWKTTSFSTTIWPYKAFCCECFQKTTQIKLHSNQLQTSYSVFAFKKTVRDSSGSGAHKLCIYNIKTKVQWKKGSEYPKNIQWRHFRVQLLQMPQQELWVGLEFPKLCHSRIMLIFKNLMICVECHYSFQSCRMETPVVILWKLLAYSSIPSPPPVQISAPAISSVRFFITTISTGQWLQGLQHLLLPRPRTPSTNPTDLSSQTLWANPDSFQLISCSKTSPPESCTGGGRQGEAELTSCKQQGKQHAEQRRGLCSLITSWPRLSTIRMVKGRASPQQYLVRQSVSSAAKYTLCPRAFLISYLLFVSKPVTTEKWGKTC